MCGLIPGCQYFLQYSNRRSFCYRGVQFFLRYFENRLIGDIHQSVKWSKKRKAQQSWRLESEGSLLSFFVDDMLIMKVRYMPLEYAGFGFYTFGNQKLIVDDVEFIQ